MYHNYPAPDNFVQRKVEVNLLIPCYIFFKFVQQVSILYSKIGQEKSKNIYKIYFTFLYKCHVILKFLLKNMRLSEKKLYF